MKTKKAISKVTNGKQKRRWCSKHNRQGETQSFAVLLVRVSETERPISGKPAPVPAKGGTFQNVYRFVYNFFDSIFEIIV